MHACRLCDFKAKTDETVILHVRIKHVEATSDAIRTHYVCEVEA